MDTMTRSEILKELAALSNRIFELSKQLSNFTDMLNEQRASDIDYIAMEAGIELEQEEDSESPAEQEDNDE